MSKSKTHDEAFRRLRIVKKLLRNKLGRTLIRIPALSDVTVPNHFGTKRSVATLFRFVARFARITIEDSNRNRFVLNGIQRIACFFVSAYSSLRSCKD